MGPKIRLLGCPTSCSGVQLVSDRENKNYRAASSDRRSRKAFVPDVFAKAGSESDSRSSNRKTQSIRRIGSKLIIANVEITKTHKKEVKTGEKVKIQKREFPVFLEFF